MELIEFHEGRRLKPYEDVTGNVTIGIGRNLTGKGLSDEEVDFLYSNDIREAVHFLRIRVPVWQEVGEVRQAALIDMYHNLGPNVFMKFKRFAERLKHLQYKEAADEMKDSKWYRDHLQWQGINNRVGRLARMIETGTWPEELL